MIYWLFDLFISIEIYNQIRFIPVDFTKSNYPRIVSVSRLSCENTDNWIVAIVQIVFILFTFSWNQKLIDE